MSPLRHAFIELALVLISQRHSARRQQALPRVTDRVPPRPNIPLIGPIRPEREHRNCELETQPIEHLEQRRQAPTVGGVRIVDEGEGEVPPIRVGAHVPRIASAAARFGGGARTDGSRPAQDKAQSNRTQHGADVFHVAAGASTRTPIIAARAPSFAARLMRSAALRRRAVQFGADLLERLATGLRCVA